MEDGGWGGVVDVLREQVVSRRSEFRPLLLVPEDQCSEGAVARPVGMTSNSPSAQTFPQPWSPLAELPASPGPRLSERPDATFFFLVDKGEREGSDRAPRKDVGHVPPGFSVAAHSRIFLRKTSITAGTSPPSPHAPESAIATNPAMTAAHVGRRMFAGLVLETAVNGGDGRHQPDRREHPFEQKSCFRIWFSFSGTKNRPVKARPPAKKPSDRRSTPFPE